MSDTEKSLRKITRNEAGTMRLLWSKAAGSDQWVLIRATPIKRVLQ